MYTLLGILAILFWSTTIAFSRTLSEQLGPLTAGASIYLLAAGQDQAREWANFFLDQAFHNTPVFQMWGRSLLVAAVVHGELLALSPFLILTFIAIKFDSRGPIFFAQQRVGKDGKVTARFVPNVAPDSSELTQAIERALQH